MEIIKEVVKINKNRYHYIIRTDCYNSSIGHFLKLFSAAKENFPELKENDVDVVHYGGHSYRYTFGIEWNSNIKPSEIWDIRSDTENIL